MTADRPGRAARQPAARPARPPAAAGARAVRARRVRCHRRPGAQEADPGDLRPGQPRPAAAGLRAARLRAPRLGCRRLRVTGTRVGGEALSHRVPRGRLETRSQLAAVPARRVRRRRRVRQTCPDAHRPRGQPRHPGQRRVLPVDPASDVPGRAQADAAHRDGRQREGRRLAASRRREAVRPRPRLGPRAQRAGRRRLHRQRRLPDRPLPRQGDGAEHAGAAVRQHAVRADLELPLRRLGADHDGRGRRHRRPRRVLRRGRRRARRPAEPRPPAARADRDGGAGLLRRRVDPDREGQGSQRNLAAGGPRALRGPRPVRPGLAGR